MAARTIVRWFGDQVRRVVNRQAQRGVETLAYDVRDRARQNLVTGNHIDTRFLYNSVYVSTPNGTSPIPPSGTYTSLKGNGQVRRATANIVTVSEGAFVGAAADYAAYVEMRYPFLYPALEETRGAADNLLTGLYIRD